MDKEILIKSEIENSDSLYLKKVLSTIGNQCYWNIVPNDYLCKLNKKPIAKKLSHKIVGYVNCFVKEIKDTNEVCIIIFTKNGKHLSFHSLEDFNKTIENGDIIYYEQEKNVYQMYYKECYFFW